MFWWSLRKKGKKEKMAKRGLIHVYTGDGKGKTTAALGLAIRARGHGLRVAYIYFHKDPGRWGYGEHRILKRIGVDAFGFATRHPDFCSKLNPEKIRRECLRGLRFIGSLYEKNKYDMIILDEINISLRDGFLKEEELLNIMKTKPRELELVLTGRGAKEEVIECADLVSEIEKIKHPYDSGVRRRPGIEY
jgi:cob(I)alamin adenosyltransferase